MTLRLSIAKGTEFKHKFSIMVEGEDNRAQFSGCILKSIAAHDQSRASAPGIRTISFNLNAEFAYFAEEQYFHHCQFGAGTTFDNAMFSEYSDFVGAKFVGCASFNLVVFSKNANFLKATFSELASFFRATFSQAACFAYATFPGYAGFVSVTFSRHAEFLRTTFTRNADFNTAIFYGDSTFDEATFGLRPLAAEDLDLTPATQLWYLPKHEVVFDGSRFVKPLSMEGATFHHPARFRSCLFEGHAKFGDAAQQPGARFLSGLSFRAAQFEQLADFSRTEFPSRAEDRNAAFEGGRFHQGMDLKAVARLPYSAFHGAHLDKGVFIDPPHPIDKQFQDALTEAGYAAERDATVKANPTYDQNRDTNAALRGIGGRFAALEGGCRVLKRAMAADIDRQREQKFYRMELIARTRRSADPNLEKLASLAYGKFADYGASIVRPLVWLGRIAAGSALVYLAVAAGIVWSDPELARPLLAWAPSQPFHPAIIDPFELALQNMLGPLQFAISDQHPFAAMTSDKPLFRLLLGGLSAVQSLISLILLFLTALALRRNFQIS